MKELSKEDKERVELQVGTSFDKISFEVRNGVNPYTYRLGFIGGAKYEHPIAFQQGETKGFNEGIEAAKIHIGHIIERAPFMDDYRDGLEKLKK